MNNLERCDGVLVLFIILVTMGFIIFKGQNLDKPITYLYYVMVMSPFILYYLSRGSYIYGKKLLNYYNRNKFENEIDIEIHNHNNLN